MKKFIAILLLSIIYSSVWAQEVIITKEGDVMNVFEVEIGAKTIFYKTESAETAPILKMNKADVFMVKFADGTKQIIEDESSLAPTQHQASTSVTSSALGNSSEASMASNKQKIDAINEAKVSYYDETKAGKAEPKRALARLGITEDSNMENDDIELSFEIKNMHGQSKDISRNMMDPALSVNIKNKSSKMLYIDLGNCFFVNNGTAIPYYIPSVTSTTQTSTTGGSLNLGAVTGALGIGGAVGTLANGVNVGGANSKGTTNLTYAPRIIPIPPMSSIVLNPQDLIHKDIKNIDFTFDFPTLHFSKKGDLQSGMSYFYPSQNSPLTYMVRLAYSSNEDCTDTKFSQVNFYLKHLFFFEKGFGTDTFASNLSKYVIGWQNVLGFVVDSDFNNDPNSWFPQGSLTPEP